MPALRCLPQLPRTLSGTGFRRERPGNSGRGRRAGKLGLLVPQFGLSVGKPLQPVCAPWGRVGDLPANLPPLQPALLDRSGQVEIVMLGIVEEPELVEALCRAAQVGQGVPPAFGDSLRVDHVSGAGKHALLDPVDIDLRIVGAEVHPLDAVASLDDAFHNGRSGLAGVGAFRAEVQPLPERFRDLRIDVHSRSGAGLRAVPVPDAASNRVLVEIARRQQVVVLALPGTLADAIATHHDGEHRAGVNQLGHAFIVWQNLPRCAALPSSFERAATGRALAAGDRRAGQVTLAPLSCPIIAVIGHLPPPQAIAAPVAGGLAAPDAGRVRKALAAALAANTRRAYLGHWRAFEAWCGTKGYAPAPAAPETVAAHLAALAETVSASTLKVRRAAVGAAHRAAGLDDPAGSELAKRTLAGLVREKAAPQRQARALGLAELAAIKATASSPRTGRQSGRTESQEKARGRGRADIALCSVLFYGGLRRSEAAALAWGDVEASEDGSGLLWVRRSKTDQEAEGDVRYLPRVAMEALGAIRLEGTDPGDPVFGLSGRQVGRRVAAAARAAGLGEGFSGHSGRTGLAAELSRAGASTHEIAAAGGWKSAGMVIRYTRRETARRGAVAKYLEGR